jgi:hypothetical protein
MSGTGLDGGAAYHQRAVGGFLPGGTGPVGGPVTVGAVTIVR